MQTEKFQRKTFMVEAVQVTEDNIDQVAKWCGGRVRRRDRYDVHIVLDVHRAANTKVVPRLKKAFLKDWVLLSEAGFKVYTKGAFANSFEPVFNSLEEGDPDQMTLSLTDG